MGALRRLSVTRQGVRGPVAFIAALALTALVAAGSASGRPLHGHADSASAGRTPAVAVGASDACKRPYKIASPWNLPIKSGRPSDPGSDAYVSWLARRGPLTSDPTQYTYPLYLVEPGTPTRTLQVEGYLSLVSNGGRSLRNVRRGAVRLPIPAAIQQARGEDAQVIVVDPKSGLEWGAYQFRRNSKGRYIAENAYVYNTRWNGVPPESGTGSPFANRGAGVPYLAGLVRRCEIDQGSIGHAIAFAYDSTTPAYVAPATKSDGSFADARGLPEGARLQLDPALTEGDLAGLGCTGQCLTIARALQRYGMILIDGSGRTKLIVEYEGTAGWNGAITAETVSGIPWSSFRVLELPTLRVRADAGVPDAPARTGGRACTVRGTADADVLVGTPGDDVICAGGGGDKIYGGDGDDVIDAGPGNDRVYAGDGDDVIDGGRGADRLNGQAGRDRAVRDRADRRQLIERVGR